MKKLIPKGQYGYRVPTQTWEDIGSVLNKGAEFFLKGLEPIGRVITSFAVSPQHGATSYATTGQYRTQEKAKEQKLKEKAFEETVGPVLSPSNHVVAWTQGSWNPKVGQQKIAEWGPLAQLGSLGVDAIGFKYAPKIIKGAPKAMIDIATKAGNKTAKKAAVAMEINKATKKGISTSNRMYIQDGGNYELYNSTGDIIGDMQTTPSPTKKGKGISMVAKKNKKYNGVSEDLYNVAIEDAKQLGYMGLESGWELFRPQLTRHVTSKFPYFEFKPSYSLLEHEPIRMLTGVSKKKQPFPIRNLTEHLYRIEPETTLQYNEALQEFIPVSTKAKEPYISTSLRFFERKPSKISKAERAGIPKGERNQPLPSFRSELDWTPEGWFEKTAKRNYKDGSLTQYTDKDIKELNSHIPEYLEIEARSKRNGTWLKMEDGSNWYGDPRSWVQMQSKNLRVNSPEDFWTGIHNLENFQGKGLINPEYNGQLWGVYGQKFLSAAKARTYAPNDNFVFHMVSSKKDPTALYDAQGKAWYDIGGKKVGEQYVTGKTTNDIINEDFSSGIKRVKIKDVSDTGPNKINTNSKYSTGDFMTDWEVLNSPGVTQNDIILAPGSFRKSLIGNNGAFNPKVKNIYKGLIPLLTGYTLYKQLDTSKNKKGGKYAQFQEIN